MTSQIDVPPRTSPSSRSAYFFLGGYAAVYVSLLVSMHAILGFEVSETLLVLGVMGLGFSGLAWWTTRKAIALPFTVKRPGREIGLLLFYLLPLTAYLAWGRNAHVFSRISEPALSVVLLLIKLLLFVAIPAMVILLAGGYRWQELFVFGGTRHVGAAIWMSVAIIGFQCVFGRGLGEIRQSGLSPGTLLVGGPLIFLFLLLEVGLVEEFFFRALLQSRLAALLKSEMGGIVGMALLFGLAHAPGFYYRSAATQEAVGPHASWLMAIGYSVVITSVAGFFLGVLWMRTRNLFVVMIVHAAGDLVPNLVPMLRNWI